MGLGLPLMTPCVLLMTYGSRGDVEPMVALAAQLQPRGAEVAVCAPAAFAHLLARARVPMVPFNEWHAPVHEYDVLVATGEPPQFTALSMAETLDIPYRYVMFAPNTLNSLDANALNELFGPSINSYRASIGLPPVSDAREFMLTNDPWLAADPILASWQGMQTGAWILPDDRPLSSDLLAFLDAGAPPVYVGFGSSSAYFSAGELRSAVEATRALGRRALLLRCANLDLIDVRDDCFVMDDDVNQQALFGRVAAAVHHGGAGTTTNAARAGIPQVILPGDADQLYYSRRVVELGIGAALDVPQLTAEALSDALRTALAPETRARARDIAGQIRTDGAAVGAELVLSAVRSGGSRASVGPRWLGALARTR